MYCIAGLDRGFAASKAAASEVSAAVNALVGYGEPVDFQGTSPVDCLEACLSPAPGYCSCSFSRACGPCARCRGAAESGTEPCNGV